MLAVHQVQRPVPRVLPQSDFKNSGPSAHSKRPHALSSNMLLAHIPNNGIPPVSDPYNTLLVHNTDGKPSYHPASFVWHLFIMFS